MKSSLTIPEYVRDALSSVAQKLHFTSNQHSVDYDFRASENNRSVVSVFYRVTFREEPREVTVLCKVPPPGADDTLLALFEREVFVYGKLLPAFEQFQRSAMQQPIPDTTTLASEEELVSFGPLCYHAHCDAKKGEGIIVLEDVQRRGFTNRHKFEPLDYDHARLAMVQLGRFHAISLALKKQQPELFDQYRYMGDVTGECVLAMEGFEQAMEQAFESASATLNPGDAGRREKLARLRGCFAEELQNISDTALSEPFCVVCHGDYAGDNMMFSYNVKSIDEDTGRVIVELAIGRVLESLTESSVQLVTVGEFGKNSNVINTAKYEQFKERESNNASAAGGSSKESSRKVDKPLSKHSSYRDRDSTNSSSEDERERHRRKHKKSSSPYIRTSSGTKKKSHKYKQRREYRDERRGSSRDRRRHRSPRSSDSDSDDRLHKKKTKKKKRPRSRSRSRQ